MYEGLILCSNFHSLLVTLYIQVSACPFTQKYISIDMKIIVSVYFVILLVFS